MRRWRRGSPPSVAEPRWNLVGFDQCLNEWVASESPSEAQRWTTGNWVLSVMEDPYRGMRREGGEANLWFGLVPGTNDTDENVVTCSYWIFEASGTVRCDRFAIMRLPL